MKYKKILVLACVMTLSAGAVFGGCSQKTADTKTTSSSTNKTNKVDSTESTTSASALFGQITAIDGNSITLTVADNMNGKAPSKGTKPSGNSTEMPQNAPSKDQNSTEKAPTDGKKPSGNSTEMPSGGNGKAPTLSGKSKTITISDSTTIEKESNGSSTKATASDLTKGSMISVTMDNNTVKMITIKDMQNNQQNKDSQSSSTQTTESSSN